MTYAAPRKKANGDVSIFFGKRQGQGSARFLVLFAPLTDDLDGIDTRESIGHRVPDNLGQLWHGGLGQRASLLYGPPAEVEAEARNAVEETGGRGLLLAPGCSVPTRAKDANLAAMVTAIAA